MSYSSLRQHTDLLPACLLAGCCVYTLLNGYPVVEETLYMLTPPHYAAMAAVTVCLLSYFFFRRAYIYLLVATLLLGLFGLIAFFPSLKTFFLGIGALRISFHPFSLLLLLVTYSLHFRRANRLLVSLFTPDPNAIVQAEAQQIERFKQRFHSKSTEELQHILDEQKLVPEALEACRQLLIEGKRKGS